MELTYAWVDNNLVITILEQQLNFNIGPRLGQVLREKTNLQYPNIILDLSHVKKINSSGLAGLIFCYKCVQGNGQLRLAGRNDNIRKVIEMSGLNQLLPSCLGVDEALGELSPH